MQIDKLPFLQNKLCEKKKIQETENSAAVFSCLYAMLNKHNWKFKESKIVLDV